MRTRSLHTFSSFFCRFLTKFFFSAQAWLILYASGQLHDKSSTKTVLGEIYSRENSFFFPLMSGGLVRSNRGTEWMDNDQYLGADTKQKPDVCYLAANQTTGQFLFHRKHLFIFIARRSRMEIARWQDRDGHNVSSERWETKSLCDKTIRSFLG